MSFFDPAHLYTRRAFVGVASYAAWVLLTGARRDARYMRYGANARRVDLTVIAGFDKSNSGFNFNAGSQSSHCIMVPAG